MSYFFIFMQLLSIVMRQIWRQMYWLNMTALVLQTQAGVFASVL